MAALVPVPVVAAACPQEARAAGHAVRCGFARVPLDHANPGGRSIRIYFERYRRRELGLPPASTVVAIEGGPGYSSTASRAGYLRLWHPVSRLRDLVLVDLRGTGRSGALACAALAKSTVGYARRGGRCAAQLGPDRDLYTTAQSVDDLDDVLQALGVARVDLYGDSYGSFAAQAFAVRHPSRLRSLVLDSTYPVTGTDPAGSDLIAAVRRGLRLSCARRAGCPARSRHIDPVALVAEFSGRLKKRPIVGTAPDGDGNPTKVRLDQDAFVQLVSASYSYYGVWRDVQAAIVSAESGDDAPILRLAAETVTVDGGVADPPAYSDPLYLAVTCHDYPQLWDPLTPLDDRRAEVGCQRRPGDRNRDRERRSASPSALVAPPAARAVDDHGRRWRTRRASDNARPVKPGLRTHKGPSKPATCVSCAKGWWPATTRWEGRVRLKRAVRMMAA